MSLEEPHGSHEVTDDYEEHDAQDTHDMHHARDFHTQSRRIASITAFLIVIALVAGLFSYYSIRRTGEGGTPTPSRTVVPTPTPTLIVPTPTQALFYETFIDNRNIWALSNRGGFVREMANGALLLTNTNPLSTLIESIPSETSYDNFTMTITFAFDEGDANDSIGLYIRGDSNLDHDYRIEMSGDSTFDIAKEYLDTQSLPQVLTLDGPERISELRPQGQLNTMIVTAQGPTIRVTLNNTLISSVTDNDYASGQIALFVRHGATSLEATMSVSAIEIDGQS
ncbi:MAG TPA: family 16 glycoside hydrolase [Ktedonobacteraceae bacterium]|nr:family 16 glycoside hydrolase [Ktedonobacteraceae bacterium]